ncbi:MAG: VTT domain-containing protein [Actinomycetaceae bacterium]|nr:VTT domain-containing protein [Actinomycetaceae bacterium]
MEAFLAIEEWVLDMGGSYWALVFLFLFCTVDGFLPIFPSETLIIALAALTAQDDGPNIVLLIATGALGAILGDQLAFGIGRRFDVEKNAFFRHGSRRRAADAARRGLRRRGPIYILAARFVPIGRVAVNLVAGATAFPRGRFTALTIVSGPIWSIYSAVIGLVAGQLLDGHPLLSMVIGVSGGIALGALLNWIIGAVSKRADERETMRALSRAAEAGAGDGPGGNDGRAGQGRDGEAEAAGCE